MKKNVFITFLLLALTASFSLYSTGCAKKDSIPEPSIGGPDEGGDEDGGGGEPDVGNGTDSSTLGFFFKVDAENKYDGYYLNKDTGWNAPCNIPASSTSSQMINCFLDVNEGDLFFHGGALEFGAPADMCHYIQEVQPWFWNFPVGRGPSEVVIEATAGTEATVVTSCTAKLDHNGATDTCANHIEIKRVDAETIKPVCVYDHSDSSDERPNCCLGSYEFTLITTTADGVKTNVTTEQWSPTVAAKSCIGGSVQYNGTAFSEDGYPKAPIYDNRKSGKNIKREIASNLASVVTNFSFASNFYSTDTNQHSHQGFYDVTPINAPYAYAPIDDLDGSSLAGERGRVGHSLICMDKAFEVKHVINLYVREWDTLSDFLAYSDSDGTVYQPDRRGETEGVDCDYGSFGTDCNDFLDFDDLLDSTGGSYNTSIPNLPLRNSWFPQYSGSK